MMKLKKLIISTLTAVTIIVSISGCGASPQEVKEKAVAALASVESYKTDRKTDIEFSSDGLTTTTHSQYSFETVGSPFYEKIEMSDIYDGEEANSTMYIVESGNEYILYMTYDNTWIKQTVDSEYLEYITNFYSFTKSVSNIIKNADTFNLSGFDTLDGTKCIKGIFTYNQENLRQGLSDINALATLGFTNIDDAILDSAGSLDITVLFDRKTYTPLKYSYDLKPTLQIILDTMYKELYNIPLNEEAADLSENPEHINVGTYSFESSISHINSITAAPLPEEINSAESFEEYYDRLIAEYYSNFTTNTSE